MKVTIRFSNIHICVLSELCNIIKHKRDDFTFIMDRVRYYVNNYYLNPSSNIYGPNNNPEYEYPSTMVNTYFIFLFIWEYTPEGRNYWNKINIDIVEYYDLHKK